MVNILEQERSVYRVGIQKDKLVIGKRNEELYPDTNQKHDKDSLYQPEKSAERFIYRRNHGYAVDYL